MDVGKEFRDFHGPSLMEITDARDARLTVSLLGRYSAYSIM